MARLFSILFFALVLLYSLSIVPGFSVNALGPAMSSQPHAVSEAPAVPGSAASSASTSYAIVFDEAGLPGGSWWTVVLNGVARTTQGGDNGIAFSEPNGTYSFQVSAAGYTADPSSGTAVVQGQSISEMIAFTLPGGPFIVTYEERGLPPGTAWSVTLNGSQQSSTTTTILFTGVPNGTYTFTTSTSSSSWQTTDETGSISVAGSSLAVPVLFEYAYPATFDAGGLPTGVQWYVNLTANFSAPASVPMRAETPHPVVYSFSSSTPALVFSLPNGSYTYTVASNSLSWTPPATNRSLTVDGASPPVQSITPLQLIPGPSSPTQLVTWVVVTIVVVAVVAVASLGYRTYALRPAPSTGPDAADELYASYELPTEVDPATADENPDPLDDIF